MANTAKSVFVARVTENLQGRSDLATAIGNALDDACVEISQLRWDELVTRSTSLDTVAGTASVTLPSDLMELLNVAIVDDTSSYNVPIRARADAEDIYPVGEEFPSTTYPAMCYREGLTLYFVPTPSSAHDLRITYRPALVFTGATPAISAAGFDNIIIAYATAQVFESIEHGDRTAERWWRIYHRRLEAKRNIQQSGAVREKIDTRLECDGAPDPRIKDPTIVWW